MPIPLRLIVPAACSHCHMQNAVVFQTVTRAGLVELMWLCRNCMAKWPVTAEEFFQTR